MLGLVLFPFMLALAAPTLNRWLGRGAGRLLAVCAAAMCAWLGLRAPEVLAGGIVRESHVWVAGLGVELSFVLDGLSLIFGLLVCGIGALVLLYGEGYFDGGEGLGRFYAQLLAFLGAMLGLVLADDLILLFVCWELTGVTSYLLIGTKHEQQAARDAARRALLVTGMGGLALLVGFLMLGVVGESFQLTELAGGGPRLREHALYPAVVMLVLLGAFTKSAQVPFHFWLPSAMSAPTPVSCFLHSATMVKAGVYLLARLQPELGGTELWHTALAVPGALTMLVGAVMAFGSRDLKAVLAYSTINALGTLVLLLGIGTVDAVKAALVFLVVHALYKCALFMVVGVIDQTTGTRDLDRLGGLARTLPLTATCAALCALSMAGVPPLFGFVAKELLYEAKIGAPAMPWLVTALGVACNVLVVAAALLIGWRPFVRASSRSAQVRERPARFLLIGPTVLALASLAVGVLPGVIAEPFVQAAVDVVHAEATKVELKLWHGINPILALSVATVAGGVTAYLLRPVLLRGTHALRVLGALGPTQLYERGLVGLHTLASAQTRFQQHGLLRGYVLVVLAAMLLLAGWPAIGGGARLPFDGRLDPTFHEVTLLLLALGACVATARATSRLSGILAMGVLGIATALFFLASGAPDLALTQVASEALMVLLFVQLLSALPRNVREGSSTWRVLSAALALVVGLALALLVRSVLELEHDSTLAYWLAERSYPEGRGRNVVNVILVDFRALDTLGEILVLGLAALGVTALLAQRQDDARATADRPRSLILATASRVVTPLLMLLSIFLLLRGHYEPGGGFVGGLVAASSLGLVAFAEGVEKAKRMLRVRPLMWIGAGLVLALASGLPGLLSGDAFLEASWATRSLPAIGTLGTPLVFDLGVYLVVLGTVGAMLLRSLEVEA